MSENSDHARRWASLITSDTHAVLGLFADDALYDDRRNIDHVFDTATSKAELRERLAPFANADPGNGLGIHRFEVLDVIDATGVDGNRAVAILWKWTGEHLENFRGVPTGGQTLSAGTTCRCTRNWACRCSRRRTGKPTSTSARSPRPREPNRLVGEHRCFPRSGANACVCRP